MAKASLDGGDSELRSELKKFGYEPGPITDTTRGLYLEKLKQLSTTTRTTAASFSGPPQTPDSTQPQLQTVIGAATQQSSGTIGAQSAAAQFAHQPASASTAPLSPMLVPHSHSPILLPPSPVSPPYSAVVSQLLQSLNNTSHLASDTAFLFPSGDVFLASRAILSTQCCELIPLLYSREDPFAINVSTLSGHSSQFFVRPNELVVDLKEKIALSEGVPIPQQRLIFTESELRNEAVIGQTGIGEGSSLRLILIPTLPGHRQSTSYFTSCSNPSLSITHCTLGLCLNQLLPVGGASPKLLPPHLPLPPHIVHIVHMYDTPFQAWMLFVHYLYSRQLWEDTTLAVDVCCYVLADHFKAQLLPQVLLSRIRASLTVESTVSLLKVAEAVNSELLRDTCMQHLKHSSVSDHHGD